MLILTQTKVFTLYICCIKIKTMKVIVIKQKKTSEIIKDKNLVLLMKKADRQKKADRKDVMEILKS